MTRIARSLAVLHREGIDMPKKREMPVDGGIAPLPAGLFCLAVNAHLATDLRLHPPQVFHGNIREEPSVKIEGPAPAI